MKIAVIGAGAIGGLVAGYLKLKGEEVSLIGHAAAVETIRAGGLRISGAEGNFEVGIDIADRLFYLPDLTIVATKTHDVGSAIKNNLGFLEDSLILTTQNGIQADDIVARYLPKENIVSSIVMFGSTSLKPGNVVHNFKGPWIIGRIFQGNDEETERIARLLSKAFVVLVADDIKGMKYLKIFVNANNCIPAILGKSMQEAFSNIELSSIGIAIWREGLDVMRQGGIKLASLPDFPLERLESLTSLPLPEAARIFSGIMTGLSKEPVYGSILQSIMRGRNSEIDYINGEFVALARKHGLVLPLNQKLVEMVHEVERTGEFFSKEELLRNTKGLVH